MPEEKQRVAYHEAGHALVACALPNTDPVHKVSIIPRGVGALGYVLQRPEDDRYLHDAVASWRARSRWPWAAPSPRRSIYGEISNGATSDLEKANQHRPQHGHGVRHEPAGPRLLPRAGDEPASCRAAAGDGERDYSEQTAREIDLEVRKIIDDAIAEVREPSCNRRAPPWKPWPSASWKRKSSTAGSHGPHRFPLSRTQAGAGVGGHRGNYRGATAGKKRRRGASAT